MCDASKSCRSILSVSFIFFRTWFPFRTSSRSGQENKPLPVTRIRFLEVEPVSFGEWQPHPEEVGMSSSVPRSGKSSSKSTSTRSRLRTPERAVSQMIHEWKISFKNADFREASNRFEYVDVFSDLCVLFSVYTHFPCFSTTKRAERIFARGLWSRLSSRRAAFQMNGETSFLLRLCSQYETSTPLDWTATIVNLLKVVMRHTCTNKKNNREEEEMRTWKVRAQSHAVSSLK